MTEETGAVQAGLEARVAELAQKVPGLWRRAWRDGVLGAGVSDCGGAVVVAERQYSVGDFAWNFLVGVCDLFRGDAEVRGGFRG